MKIITDKCSQKKSKINGLTTLAVGFPKPCPLSVSIFINNGFV